MIETCRTFSNDGGMTGVERRQAYKKDVDGKVHSLDESCLVSHAGGGLKASTSECHLNMNGSLPVTSINAKTSSRLCLLADKVIM